eukprot:TRINITY_DN12698_c0_g4_i1.p1 TRINITY_DN12698_c0_g4~~TRINITY_DN12698_c0_g4_i1.p1  ORF type:complete len:505 (-),score=88.18 TRINITY_DN12698_c0_g4_i1:15-1529(-)
MQPPAAPRDPRVALVRESRPDPAEVQPPLAVHAPRAMHAPPVTHAPPPAQAMRVAHAPGFGQPRTDTRDTMKYWEQGRLPSTSYLRNKVGRASAVNHAQTIPDYVLEELCLVNDGQATRGFRFSRDPENPKIVYDLQQCCGLYCYPNVERARDEDMGYARVVTKNTFYDDLWSTIRSVCVDALDEYSHLNFCAILLYHSDYEAVSFAERLTFVVVFVLCDLISLTLAFDRARRGWCAMVLKEEGGQTSAGDLVISSADCRFDEHPPSDGFAWCPACISKGACCCCFFCVRSLWRSFSNLMQRRAPPGRGFANKHQRLAWYSEWQLFLQLWLMEFFGVRKRISEHFIQVHPFHRTMPWSAFQRDHARAVLQCYENKSMWRYEDNAGLEWSLPLEFFIKVLLFFVKMRLAIGLSQSLSLPLLALSVGPTFFSLYLRAIKWRTLRKDRTTFKAYLKAGLAEKPQDADLKRLWEKHFSEDRLTAQIKRKWRRLSGKSQQGSASSYSAM